MLTEAPSLSFPLKLDKLKKICRIPLCRISKETDLPWISIVIGYITSVEEDNSKLCLQDLSIENDLEINVAKLTKEPHNLKTIQNAFILAIPVEIMLQKELDALNAVSIILTEVVMTHYKECRDVFGIKDSSALQCLSLINACSNTTVLNESSLKDCTAGGLRSLQKAGIIGYCSSLKKNHPGSFIKIQIPNLTTPEISCLTNSK